MQATLSSPHRLTCAGASAAALPNQVSETCRPLSLSPQTPSRAPTDTKLQLHPSRNAPCSACGFLMSTGGAGSSGRRGGAQVEVSALPVRRRRHRGGGGAGAGAVHGLHAHRCGILFTPSVCALVPSYDGPRQTWNLSSEPKAVGNSRERAREPKLPATFGSFKCSQRRHVGSMFEEDRILTMPMWFGTCTKTSPSLSSVSSSRPHELATNPEAV